MSGHLRTIAHADIGNKHHNAQHITVIVDIIAYHACEKGPM
jgi:hypothetical protein